MGRAASAQTGLQNTALSDATVTAWAVVAETVVPLYDSGGGSDVCINIWRCATNPVDNWQKMDQRQFGLMRRELYSQGEACSVDSLRAARAIFIRHRDDYGVGAKADVPRSKECSAAALAARMATTNSASVSEEDLCPPALTAYRSVSGSSASLVSTNSSQGSVPHIDSSLSALNLDNSPAKTTHHYISTLQLVKHKLHRHTKQTSAQAALVLSHRENKLKSTLRPQRDTDRSSSMNNENIEMEVDYTDGWGSTVNSTVPPAYLAKPPPKKQHASIKQRIKSKIKKGPVGKKHHGPCFDSDKPWKSHRDANYISREERTRYEAMWMANRFRFLPTLHWWPPSADGEILLPEDGLIHSLVVREIWQRSNLAPPILSDIWRLVDTRSDGTLDRRSFIIGMWLVDQCLYGCKLPTTVSQAVWDSVDKFAVSITMNDRIANKTKKKRMRQELKDIKKHKH